MAPRVGEPGSCTSSTSRFELKSCRLVAIVLASLDPPEMNRARPDSAANSKSDVSVALTPRVNPCGDATSSISKLGGSGGVRVLRLITRSSLHALARFSFCAATRGFESHCTSRHASSLGNGQPPTSWLCLNPMRTTGASSSSSSISTRIWSKRGGFMPPRPRQSARSFARFLQKRSQSLVAATARMAASALLL